MTPTLSTSHTLYPFHILQQRSFLPRNAPYGADFSNRLRPIPNVCGVQSLFVRKDILNSLEFEIFYQRKLLMGCWGNRGIEILSDNVMDWCVRYVKSEKKIFTVWCNLKYLRSKRDYWEYKIIEQKADTLYIDNKILTLEQEAAKTRICIFDPWNQRRNQFHRPGRSFQTEPTAIYRSTCSTT